MKQSRHDGHTDNDWVSSLVRDWREVVPALRAIFTARRAMPRRIDSVGELPDALAREAAFLAQSSVYTYSRARTGFMAPKLFDETPFLRSLEICVWHAYVACLSDVFAIVEGRLRPFFPAPNDQLADRLMVLFSEALKAQDFQPPEDRDEGTDVQAFRDRLAKLQLADPLPIVTLVEHSAQIIFDYLPFHEQLLRPDEEMVFNSVRFRFLRFAEDLDRKADFPSLARQLTEPAKTTSD